MALDVKSVVEQWLQETCQECCGNCGIKCECMHCPTHWLTEEDTECLVEMLADHIYEWYTTGGLT